MKTIISAITLLFLLSTTFEVASADPTGGTNVDLVQSLVPSVYDETRDTSEVKISENAANNSVEVQDEGLGRENSDVRIAIPDSYVLSRDPNGMEQVGSLSGQETKVIQPLAEGFRVLSFIKQESDAHDFTYKIEAPEGAQAEVVADTVRVSLGDEILGSIKKPWAVDASGRQLNTYFILNGMSLTQHVDITPSTIFPVVADPNWGYLMTFTLREDYWVSWNKLHACFNCYFPVVGAPRSWPAFGQLLPLKVIQAGQVVNMECKMNYTWHYSNLYRWQFLATKNHVDGLGSNIIFDLRVNSVGRNQLVIDAYIVNDWGLPIVGNAVYQQLAWENWAHFANNLNAF